VTVSEGGRELEPGRVVQIRSGSRRAEEGFPQQRVTSFGRRVGVDTAFEPERLVFTERDRVVAELHPPSNAGGTGESLLGWRLTFPEGSDRMLAAPAGRPPISTALFFVDIALRERG
jgi:hypothetical protein